MNEQGEGASGVSDTSGGSGPRMRGQARTSRSWRGITVRRALCGLGVAVAGTAAMVAVTVPLTASGEDGTRSSTASSGTDPAGGRGGDAPAVIESAPPVTSTGVGSDPLTADEEARAKALALGKDRTLRTASEDVRGRAGAPQYLRVELVEDPDGGLGATAPDRTADVYFYDYRDDTLVRKTVNLATGEVTASAPAPGAQPPPSRQEAREAVTVLLENPAGAGVKQDYRAATGRELTDPGQLDVRALVYRARGTASRTVAECGEHRCVTLFTRVKNGPWINTRHLVVDLSDRSAVRLG